MAATKKLCLELADMLAELHNNPEAPMPYAIAIADVEKTIIQILSMDNPRFDADKFRQRITATLNELRGSNESDS